MKASTLLFFILAGGLLLHIYLPAQGTTSRQVARSTNAPTVSLVGQVTEKTTEGMIVNCSRELGASYATGGAVNAFGRFLIKGHPNESEMSKGQLVSIRGLDEGTCYSGSELLQTYRYVGGWETPAVRPPGNPWHNSLDEPTKSIGPRSR